MKARVKATGEIVDVYSSIHKGCDYDGSDGYSYMKEDIIILDDEPDYWTRLEHQAAIGAMQGLLSNPSITERELTTRKGIVEDAERLANALVEKYKKEERK